MWHHSQLRNVLFLYAVLFSNTSKSLLISFFPCISPHALKLFFSQLSLSSLHNSFSSLFIRIYVFLSILSYAPFSHIFEFFAIPSLTSKKSGKYSPLVFLSFNSHYDPNLSLSFYLSLFFLALSFFLSLPFFLSITLSLSLLYFLPIFNLPLSLSCTSYSISYPFIHCIRIITSLPTFLCKICEKISERSP